MNIKKKIKRLKKDPEYIFAKWCEQFGWEPEKPTGNTHWVNGSSRLTLCQLQQVFKDYKEAHQNDSD